MTQVRERLVSIHRAVEFASFEACGGRVYSPGDRFYLWGPMQDLTIAAINVDASGRCVHEALKGMRMRRALTQDVARRSQRQGYVVFGAVGAAMRDSDEKLEREAEDVVEVEVVDGGV